MQLVHERHELGRHRFDRLPLVGLALELAGDGFDATPRIEELRVQGAQENADTQEQDEPHEVPEVSGHRRVSRRQVEVRDRQR